MLNVENSILAAPHSLCIRNMWAMDQTLDKSLHLWDIYLIIVSTLWKKKKILCAGGEAEYAEGPALPGGDMATADKNQ